MAREAEGHLRRHVVCGPALCLSRGANTPADMKVHSAQTRHANKTQAVMVDKLQRCHLLAHGFLANEQRSI